MTRPDPLAEPEGYGSRLGRLEHLTQPAAPEMLKIRTPPGARGLAAAMAQPDTICDMADSAGRTLNRCTRERNWHWVTGCVHEHICELDLCDAHEVQTRVHILLGSPLNCNGCGLDENGRHRERSEVQKRARVLPDGSLEWLEDGRIQRPTPVLWDDTPEGEDHDQGDRSGPAG